MSTVAASVAASPLAVVVKTKLANASPVTLMAGGRLLYNAAATGVAYYSLGGPNASVTATTSCASSSSTPRNQHGSMSIFPLGK